MATVIDTLAVGENGATWIISDIHSDDSVGFATLLSSYEEAMSTSVPASNPMRRFLSTAYASAGEALVAFVTAGGDLSIISTSPDASATPIALTQTSVKLGWTGDILTGTEVAALRMTFRHSMTA